MLAALETGVKGGKWFSLIDKVYSLENLQASFEKVSSNGGSAGVDHEGIKEYEKHLESNLERLSEQLRAGTYCPQAIRRVWIPKPGSREQRPLGIPTVRDRVVQTALRNVVEPIFEREFADNSYGFRPGRGCKDALREVDRLLKSGHGWVVDADLRGYFDSIPKAKLKQRVTERIADGRVLSLLEQFLQQEVLEEMKQWTPESGTPQGAVISPLLANVYLNPLDWKMRQEGLGMIRYADDFVILCRDQAQAEGALRLVQEWVKENGLSLHPEKTSIVNWSGGEGFDFLGYHFEGGKRWPRRKSEKKFKDTIRQKTPRCSGYGLQATIADINRTLKGWFEYYKHSHHNVFSSFDGWIRMRLRSILRKRIGLKGRGRGADHQRWTNAYFAEQGLFSLVQAHAQACQSAKR